MRSFEWAPAREAECETAAAFHCLDSFMGFGFTVLLMCVILPCRWPLKRNGTMSFSNASISRQAGIDIKKTCAETQAGDTHREL